MTYDEAIAYFGTQTKLGAALGITQGTVSAWDKIVPPRYQYQIEVITGGALLVDPDLRVAANSPSATVRAIPQQAAYAGPERRQPQQGGGKREGQLA